MFVGYGFSNVRICCIFLFCIIVNWTFWGCGQTKQDIWRSHIQVWKIARDILHYFLGFSRLLNYSKLKVRDLMSSNKPVLYRKAFLLFNRLFVSVCISSLPLTRKETTTAAPAAPWPSASLVPLAPPRDQPQTRASSTDPDTRPQPARLQPPTVSEREDKQQQCWYFWTAESGRSHGEGI